MLTHLLTFALVAPTIPALAAAQSADNYLARLMRLVGDFGSGAPDPVAGLVATHISTQIGQLFIVNNRFAISWG